MLAPTYIIPPLPPGIDLETVPILKALNAASRALADLKGQARAMEIDCATASLRTLTPPDAAMVEAGSSVAFESPTYQDDIAAVFTAMIQTAMGGK